jgi:7-cyano-7-deazaguanine synthase
MMAMMPMPPAELPGSTQARPIPTGSTRAVVLLSGGLDSATTLAIARAEGLECYALSVDYGQRHRAELAAAQAMASRLGAQAHRVMHMDFGSIGGSALTDPAIAVPRPGEGSAAIPVTYVPARNTVMLALALGWAEVLEASRIYIGVNAVDYSGYPDCRPEFIAAFERLASLATRAGVEGTTAFRICTPLIDLSKAEIIQRAVALDVDLSLTVSCYQADPEGMACGQCDACQLRRAGFSAAGIADPTRYVR